MMDHLCRPSQAPGRRYEQEEGVAFRPFCVAVRELQSMRFDFCFDHHGRSPRKRSVMLLTQQKLQTIKLLINL